MTSTTKALLLAVCFCLVCSLLVTSAVSAAIEGGDARRGEGLALENCKPCHVQGAEAGTMTPISKTQKQWERFFSKERHAKVAPGAWDKIVEKDLKDIMQFMYDHAADSDQPSTCGK